MVGPVPPARTEPAGSGLPAKRNTNGDRSLTRALGLKLGRVVLDPGHGGVTMRGRLGRPGLLEKDLVLGCRAAAGRGCSNRGWEAK